MSRLSDILGVKEGQEFRFNSPTGLVGYSKSKIQDGRRWSFDDGKWIISSSEAILSEMIAHPEFIQPITNLTEQQITAIKGRIAEGTPWAARDGGEKYVYFYGEKPKLSEGKTYFYTDEDDGISHSDLYDFITFENSPVYLPEIVEGGEQN